MKQGRMRYLVDWENVRQQYNTCTWSLPPYAKYRRNYNLLFLYQPPYYLYKVTYLDVAVLVFLVYRVLQAKLNVFSFVACVYLVS